MAVEVRTKMELAIAIKNKENEIIIYDNDLAESVRKFKGVPNLTKTEIATACLTGLEIVYLFGLIVLGLTVLYALYKDYDVEVRSGDNELILKRS